MPDDKWSEQIQDILDSTQVEAEQAAEEEPLMPLGDSVKTARRQLARRPVEDAEDFYQAMLDRIGEDNLVDEQSLCPYSDRPDHCHDGSGVILREKDGTTVARRCKCHPGYPTNGIYFFCTRQLENGVDPKYYTWDQ